MQKQTAAPERQIGEVERTDAARELWHSLYSDISRDRPGLVGCLTARAEAQVMRLALLYAVLDGSAFIDVPHLMAGIAVWQYCEQSVACLWGGRVGDSLADTILAALVEAGEEGMTRTDIRGVVGHHESAARIGSR